MILHLIQHSPAHSNMLSQCLAVASSEYMIVLMADGVLALLNQTPIAHANIRAITADIAARGLQDKVNASTMLIDYSDFVTLSLTSEHIVTW